MILRPVIVLFIFCVTCVSSVEKYQFYPFGDELDRNLPRDIQDVSSPEVKLSIPIIFFEEVYDSIFVNSNGLVSFLTEIPNFFNMQFPLDYPIVAPFYSDVDTRSAGAIYYRETQDYSLLERAKEQIQDHFSFAEEFDPKSLFIVTWDGVGYYNNGQDKKNTFQLVLVTDGDDSFAIFLFGDNGIQWIQGQGKSPNLPDARAQSGIMSGDGRMYVLRGSGSDKVKNLNRLSNIGEAGKWLFHVGRTGAYDNVALPDLNTGEDLEVISNYATSCAIGSTSCHSKASCRDYHPGFCCKCDVGFYGNGENCLQQGIPQRLTGKLSGTINDQAFKDQDLFSYVVTTDGRAYTAVSRIPSSIGFDIQSLSIIGGIIGWLFAKPMKNANNGFQITGGIFNYTAEIRFPQTGHQATITQYYLGMDVFNQLRMEGQLRGTVPTVPSGSRIEMRDYEEEYTKSSTGVIRSRSTRSFRLEGNSFETPFTIEQTITIEECVYLPESENPSDTYKLRVGRNYIIYDAKEQIVRFAMSNKISTLDSEEDPCKEGKQKCGPNSACVVEGDNFRCICNIGYELLYADPPTTADSDVAVCVDINECDAGLHNCDANALCINEPGNFVCRCNLAYEGNGIVCREIRNCDNMDCQLNSQCVEHRRGDPSCVCVPGFLQVGPECMIDTQPPYVAEPDCGQENYCDPFADCVWAESKYECRCRAGYTGTGIICARVSDTCDVISNCSPIGGACSYDDHLAEHVCICLPGYTGDGYSCTEILEPSVLAPDDAPDPTCVLGICWCRTGYQYDGDRCELDENNKGEDVKISCNVVNNCHPHARCVFQQPINEYRCQCNAGYEGNGYQCYESDVSCDKVDICDIHATCVYDDYTLRSVCACNPGYKGDGTFCSPEDDCSTLDDCHPDAQCYYDIHTFKYKCKCNEGFEGDGKHCSLTEERAKSCNVENNCHRDATCIYDPQSFNFICQCNPGYIGDGRTCNLDVISCNILNNCGTFAQCVYEPTVPGYRCKCDEGFVGDGHQCQTSSTCYDDPTTCDNNAICMPEETNGNLQYNCRCEDNYEGDGFTCKVTPKFDGNFLLVNQGMVVLRVPVIENTNSSTGKPIHVLPFQTAIAIGVDCPNGHVYWSDVTGRSISRSSYDGSDKESFLTQDIGSPEGLVIDWMSRNMYWTDSLKDTVEVSNLETQNRKVLFAEGLVNPRGIAVHPGRGKLFWSDWNRLNPKIESSNMDGTSRTLFIDRDLGLPNSLIIDFTTDELCWADAGTKRLECISVDNRNRRIILTSVKYPFGLTIYKNTLYWTDWETHKVESASKDDGNINQSIDIPFGGSGKLYGLIAVPTTCNKVFSPCRPGQNSCVPGQICLPNGRGGHSCICATSTNDQKTSELPECEDIY